MCAISQDENSNEMDLTATNDHRYINSTDMFYREGNPQERRYSACYYEIKADANIQTNSDEHEGHENHGRGDSTKKEYAV